MASSFDYYNCSIWKKGRVKLLDFLLILWENSIILKLFDSKIAIYKQRWIRIWLQIKVIIEADYVLKIVYNAVQIKSPLDCCVVSLRIIHNIACDKV